MIWYSGTTRERCRVERHALRLSALAVFALAFVCRADAAALTPGNLLIQNNGVVKEISLEGDLVQSFEVPRFFGTGIPRDVVVSSDGDFYVRNGQYGLISHYDIRNDTWHHQSTDAGLHGNNTFGHLAVDDQFLYLSAEGTPNGGVVRIDLATESTSRIGQPGRDTDYISLGSDGRIYTLTVHADVRVYDSHTGEHLMSQIINEPHPGVPPHGLAVDADGSMFIVGGNPTHLYHFSADGTVLNSILVSDPPTTPFDVALSADGLIAIGNTSGIVQLTDRELSFLRRLDLGNGAIFVTFVPIPEPSGLFGILSSMVFGVCFARRGVRRYGR